MGLAHKINGGMFGTENLQVYEKNIPPFLKGKCLKLINGRSGIYILCDILKPQKVWIPSYHCHSMIKAISKEVTIKFYPIGMDLKVKKTDWIGSLNKGDLVIFIDYFGFDLHRKCMKMAKDKGAWILQDAAQALLSNFGRPYADFVLYSPRKTIGVPDGGILHSNCQVDFSEIFLKEAPAEFVVSIYNAFTLRTIFDHTGAGDWFFLYKNAESVSPVGYYRMTDYASSLLLHGFDYSFISQTRRANYNKLYTSLSKYAVLTKLPDNVVPLGFPACFPNRDGLIKKLHNESIFCPVHWACAVTLPKKFKDTFRLIKEEITLLCDQRIEQADIQKTIAVIRENLCD